MDYSKGLKSAVNKAKISIEEKIFADLLYMGWKETDAYVAAFGYNVNFSDNYIRRKIREILTDPNYLKYAQSADKKVVEEIRSEDSSDMTNEEALSLATKEQTLKELIIAKSKMKSGSKEWLDTTKLIADLQQMKKDIVDEEDTTIHYYIPLNCFNCSLYKANLEKKKK